MVLLSQKKRREVICEGIQEIRSQTPSNLCFLQQLPQNLKLLLWWGRRQSRLWIFCNISSPLTVQALGNWCSFSADCGLETMNTSFHIIVRTLQSWCYYTMIILISWVRELRFKPRTLMKVIDLGVAAKKRFGLNSVWFQTFASPTILCGEEKPSSFKSQAFERKSFPFSFSHRGWENPLMWSSQGPAFSQKYPWYMLPNPKTLTYKLPCPGKTQSDQDQPQNFTTSLCSQSVATPWKYCNVSHQLKCRNVCGTSIQVTMLWGIGLCSVQL